MPKTTEVKKVKGTSLTKRRIQKFCKNPMSVIALVILAILILASVFAPVLTPYDPALINMKEKGLPMSWEHPLGTDRMGRDLFARILYGGRWSLFIGIATSLCVNFLGSALGVVAGYFGGKVDSLIVSCSELVTLLPTTLIIILLSSSMPITVWVLILLWTLMGWSGTMRMVRSRVVSLKQEPFVESCVANGIPKRSIMFHHIIPNTTGPIIVNTTMNVAGYILSEAALSYLGFGLDSSIPTWGNILNAVKRMDVILNDPIQWIAPGACILILVLCVNYLGDGLRDAMDATTK